MKDGVAAHCNDGFHKMQGWSDAVLHSRCNFVLSMMVLVAHESATIMDALFAFAVAAVQRLCFVVVALRVRGGSCF